jgi:hypothetical protein
LRRITFYRAALFLPVIVPAVLWAVLSGFGEQISMRDADAELAAFFLYSLPIAGVPYILFACGFAWWMRDKAPGVLRQATFRAPILFIPCVWLVLLLQSILFSDPAATGGVPGLLLVAFGVLLVGYTYVGVVEAARWCAERVGFLPRQPAA